MRIFDFSTAIDIAVAIGLEVAHIADVRDNGVLPWCLEAAVGVAIGFVPGRRRLMVTVWRPKLLQRAPSLHVKATMLHCLTAPFVATGTTIHPPSSDLVE